MDRISLKTSNSSSGTLAQVPLRSDCGIATVSFMKVANFPSPAPYLPAFHSITPIATRCQWTSVIFSLLHFDLAYKVPCSFDFSGEWFRYRKLLGL